jgi:hypothetical protein
LGLISVKNCIFLKNINNFMKLFEILDKKYYYVANCTNSFDEDGYCTSPLGNWDHINDFAVSEENKILISKEIFFSKCDIPKNLLKIISSKKHTIEYQFYKNADICALYDETNDIHYFFS